MRTRKPTVPDAFQHAPSAHSTFHPLTTLKCEGPATFRSQAARDVACLLDLDYAVSSWRCHSGSAQEATPDFLVAYLDGGRRYLDAPDKKGLEASLKDRLDGAYHQLSHEDVYGGYRLRNAHDLLRYGKWRTSLGDRVRLLAALDEHGSLSLSECLIAIQETQPMAGLASLILFGFVEVNLDDALIGPETTVRRIRR